MNPHPEKTQVVVIGGGVVGVSAALYLAEKRIPVVLCEKGVIAGEQSSRNWGWIRRQGRDLAELPLMNESLGLWKRWSQEVGTDIGFRQGGISYLSQTNKEIEKNEHWLNSAQALVADAHLLSRAKANQLAGRDDQHFIGGMLTPGDCYAEPALAVPALSRLATSKGAVIHEHRAVRGLRSEAGRITGVVTEHGEIACQAVILAGGIWSRVLMENEGLSFAQLAVISSVMRTSPVPPIASCTLWTSHAALRPRTDGGYTVARTGGSRFDMIPAALSHLPAFLPLLRQQWPEVRFRAGRSFFGPLGRRRWQLDQASPFEQVRTMDPSPDASHLRTVLQDAQRLFPGLQLAQPIQSWAGMIDVTPDEVAVVSEVPEKPGLVLASGMSGHGFGFGPGAGMLAAQLATAEQPRVDPAPLSLSRFMRAAGKAAA